MSDTFYRAVKAQKNLDKIYPDRYWPVGATEPPKPHIITITKLYVGGMRQCDIVRSLGFSKDTVSSIVKRSRFNQARRVSCKT